MHAHVSALPKGEIRRKEQVSTHSREPVTLWCKPHIGQFPLGRTSIDQVTIDYRIPQLVIIVPVVVYVVDILNYLHLVCPAGVILSLFLLPSTRGRDPVRESAVPIRAAIEVLEEDPCIEIIILVIRLEPVSVCGDELSFIATASEVLNTDLLNCSSFLSS